MIKWNYKSEGKQSNGYEDVMEELKKYNRESFTAMTGEEKDSVVDKVMEIYRGKNIFPIIYYNREGVLSEIQKCVDKEVVWEEGSNLLDFRYNQGQSLCRFLFPNMQEVEVKGAKDNSPYFRFHDDHKLRKAILFCLNHKKTKSPVVPSGLKDGLEMIGGGVATNFKTMNAKALFERYTPVGGTVYDFSCGYGGRMLGALSSKKDLTYLGVEPNTKTHENLLKLGEYIEEVTGRRDSFEVRQVGSEKVNLPEGVADFAFSSPPYFNLEVYSTEETQSCVAYPTLEEWFDGYVSPTIEGIYKVLKPEGKYAVNIADFKVGKDTVNFVDRWVSLSEQKGFRLVEEIAMSLQKRRGAGHGENTRGKREGVYVFEKTTRGEVVW